MIIKNCPQQIQLEKEDLVNEGEKGTSILKQIVKQKEHKGYEEK